MPSNIKIPIPANGVSQRWNDKAGAASDITNARWDSNGGGWLFDRGLHQWWKISDTGGAPQVFRDYIENTIDSVFVWTKQSSGQTYYLFEQNGDLQYFWGNKNGGTFDADKVVLDTGRHLPKAGDAGTQYIPFGNRLLIINGYDKPVWFYGDNRVRDFGFLIPTPAPNPMSIEPDYHDGTTRLQQGTASPKIQNLAIGLGDSGENEASSFGYRMTFVTDTGSESPMSGVAYTSWKIPSSVPAAQRRYGVMLTNVARGPKGTVARRIYRTKNSKLPGDANAGDGSLFFIKQINENFSEEFIDIIPDTSLTDSVNPAQSTVIDTGYAYGANWNGRLWLAGGHLHPTRIIYSEAGLPEQFGTANYFELGNTSGGAITQLYAYYNNLLVFREHSIDVIRTNRQAFTHSTVDSSVGTKGSNTVCNVPGVGVMFLTQDGLYALSGGLDGGSSIRVERAPAELGEEESRVSVAALPRATAAYSRREKEYWVHYPVAGKTVPTRGIVFHSEPGLFSFRHAVDKANDFAYQFTALATDPSGYFILGTKPTWLLNGNVTPNSQTAGSKGYLTGLQVWCGTGNVGTVLTSSGFTGQGYDYTAADSTRKDNHWQSNWIDFGDNKARIFHVEVDMVAYGDNDIELEWGYDYESEWNSAGTQSPSKPETAKTSSADPVMGPADTSVTKRPFVLGTDKLKSPRVIRLRWDVNTGLVDNFRFRLSSEHTMHLISYNLYANGESLKALNQRARNSYGQPR